MTFNPWLGLGSSLKDANLQWNTQLMPGFLAQVAQWLAEDYSKNPGLGFESMMEYWLYFSEPTLTDNEMHAAKCVIGKVFAANRKPKTSCRNTFCKNK